MPHPGFETTASGLQYKDIEVGTGAVPQPGQLIAAHYSGYLLANGPPHPTPLAPAPRRAPGWPRHRSR